MRRTASFCRSRWACTAAAWLILIGLVVGIAFAAVAQKSPISRKKALVRQGICGIVTELKGNHMPQVAEDGKASKSSAGKPVMREVLIYVLLSMEQVEMTDDGFVKEGKGIKPVRIVKTDNAGKFCAYDLPAGQYSVLVREAKGLYASVFDGKNNLNPVVVKKNYVTKAEIAITHQAAF